MKYKYRHTQISYLMIVITLAMFDFFVRAIILARAEPPSVDSGTNLAVILVMILIILILSSFTTLTVSIDENYLRLKFGLGIISKKFLLKEISEALSVKNRWYYGWGVRVLFRPFMWIYNVSGFDAVQITMKNGKIYRIGTDEPSELEMAINHFIRNN